MSKLGNTLLLIGGIFLVFSSVITFKTKLPDEIENIIYFRGILFGSFLFILGSAILQKDMFVQNMLISLGSGNLCLLVVSTANLFFDRQINLDSYFDFTIIATLVTLIILLIFRVWLSRILKFFRF